MNDRKLGEWQLCYQGWDPASQPHREALMTLGNGLFATRGALEEVSAGGPHYPGTYLMGGYNRAKSSVAGRVIENEDLVNWPNWLPISFRCEDESWFDMAAVQIIDYVQWLDLLGGVLSKRMHVRDRRGREFRVQSRRIVHMEMTHLAAIQWTLTPLNWSGRLEIRSAIDGRVTNRGVARYRDLQGEHLQADEGGQWGDEVVSLRVRTKQSQIVMAQAIRTRVSMDSAAGVGERLTELQPGWAAHVVSLRCEANTPIQVEKILTVYSSRDFAISEPCADACERICRAPNFEALLKRHRLAWKRLWRQADLKIVEPGEQYAQMVLRLHIFHLLQTVSMNTIGHDVSIPARGLHGEAYRGHVFWDELFIFPFLNLRMPELTRSLLLYRHRRLEEARHAAKQAGYEGAMFPWQSGSNGREESQKLHLNPQSNRWLADNTYRQRHVNSAIAYSIWHYHQATNDVQFLSFYGAEMLLEIARFWASMAAFDQRRERYVIRGVVGPDEFHTKYPGQDTIALDNNAYTNVMAAWVLSTARSALELLGEDRRAELQETLNIADDDLARWDAISRQMYVPFHEKNIVSQFEGWENLHELDWDGLKQRHGNIQRLDRLLEAEGDDPNRYKAAKQADVLMLFFLFSSAELREIFNKLGYHFDKNFICRNIKYYMARTSHGSTLSHVVHAWVLARANRKRSWHLFREALANDIEDVQGGTTSEGIHLGAMAGTVDMMQRCYTGIDIRCGVLWLDPELPKELDELNLGLHYRGHWLKLQLTQTRLRVTFEQSWAGRARIGFRGQVYDMQQGEQVVFSLETAAP